MSPVADPTPGIDPISAIRERQESGKVISGAFAHKRSPAHAWPGFAYNAERRA